MAISSSSSSSSPGRLFVANDGGVLRVTGQAGEGQLKEDSVEDGWVTGWDASGLGMPEAGRKLPFCGSPPPPRSPPQ